MLITPIDLAFLFAGLLVSAAAFARRRRPPPPAPPPPGSAGELALTALAAVPAAVGPSILVVALSPGMPGMPMLTLWVLLPSVLVLLGVVLLAGQRGHERLVNRIWTGVWVGAAATASLDALRLVSFATGLLPGNMPRMFGVLILGTMATGPTPLSDLVGQLYHYWVSACFGLTYALLVGRTRWWGALIWALIIEVGMMTTPPMVIAMDTGLFGLRLGKGLLNGVFLGSLVPHISYGIVLGLLLERYLHHRGSVLALAGGVLRHRGPPPPTQEPAGGV